MTDRLTEEQWGAYWRHGTVTTFHGRFADNYDGRIRDHWHRVLDATPSNGRIVDLATGNGAIALIAAEYSERHSRGFEIVGVDSADIAPAETLGDKAPHLEHIRFLGKTPLEATALPEASFHLATSQFGFEYAEHAAAVDELHRLLKPTGSTFAALIHHADSALLRHAKDGLAQVQACEGSGLHPPLRELHRRLEQLAKRGQDPHDDAKAKQLRATVNEHLAALRDAGAKSPDPSQIVFYVEQSMATFNPAVAKDATRQQKLAVLDNVAAETAAYAERMRDMVSAAMDDAEIHWLADRFAHHGFEIAENQPFVFEGNHFCHTLTVRR